MTSYLKEEEELQYRLLKMAEGAPDANATTLNTEVVNQNPVTPPVDSSPTSETGSWVPVEHEDAQ